MEESKQMVVSQSLIKAVLDPLHCPRQILYQFIEGKDIEPSDVMRMGRYFESELLGACRGGLKEPAKYKTINTKPSKTATKAVKVKWLEKRGHDCTGLNHDALNTKLQYEKSDFKRAGKLDKYIECDELVEFAQDVMSGMGMDLSKGESQLSVIKEGLSASIDHRNNDLRHKDMMANYDVKWTMTKPYDKWNGWGAPEYKSDAWIQAVHYSYVSYLETGEWLPFYFVIFGKGKWVRVIRFIYGDGDIADHKRLIANTVATVKEYAENDYKGNGDYNKCSHCPFKEICPDRSNEVLIEEIYRDQ